VASETRKPLVSTVTWGSGAPPGTRTPNPLIASPEDPLVAPAFQKYPLMTCAFVARDLSAIYVVIDRFSLKSMRKSMRSCSYSSHSVTKLGLAWMWTAS
jgi:hypothetical protein